MLNVMDTQAWAESVFGGCTLGDKRRTARLVKLAAQLGRHSGHSVSRSCEGDEAAKEGAYRWLRNSAIGYEQVATGGFDATARAAQGHELLLAVEDSTTLSFRHGVAEALGDTGGKCESQARGVWAHSVLLLDGQSGQTLGLIEQQLWQRDGERGSRHKRKERALEDKESYKWQQASEAMSRRLGETMKGVISVCDRESDIHAYLEYKQRTGQRFVVRAAQDRRLDEGTLFTRMEGAPELGRLVVKVAQRGGRRAREAHLRVHAMRVRLQPPKNGAPGEAVEVNVVWAHEDRRKAEPLSWVLLTSEAVTCLADAQQILEWYRLRWRIEEFHKAWKSGAGVEAQRLQQRDNVLRLSTVLAFVAVRLLQLREVVSEVPEAAELPCTRVLSDDEWRVLWASTANRRPPTEAPSLAWAYRALAKLGGFLDTKRTGVAGWATLWDGWYLLNERMQGFRLARRLSQ